MSGNEMMQTKTIAKLMIALAVSCGSAYWQVLNNPNNLPPYLKDQGTVHHNCWGTDTWSSGDKYVGEFKDNSRNGQGTLTFAQGHGYTGQWLDGKTLGMGRETYADSRQPNEGVFENGTFIRLSWPPVISDLRIAQDEFEISRTGL